MTRVLELAPQRTEALFNRAMAYQIRGDHDQAIADLERYLVEGNHPYWRESAERQLGLLREIAAELKARRDSKTC